MAAETRQDDEMSKHCSGVSPDDEVQRLRALDSYQIMDSGPEPAVDALVRLAQRLFNVPIALVSFVAEDRLFFKARVGIDVGEAAREQSFCSHSVLCRDVLVVGDAALDERFRRSPFVTEEPRIRFYAGAPLVTPDGFVIGSFCILDVVPRPSGISSDERRFLTDMAALVMDKIEGRRLSAAEADGRRRFDAVAGSSADAIVCGDGGNRILSWNSAAERMFGYRAEEAVGQLLNIIVPPRFHSMHEAGLLRAASGLPTRLVGSLVKVPALRRDGTEFPIELSLSHWLEGGQHRFGAIARDITDRLATETRLKRAAEYDPLTDLANRSVLTERLTAASVDGRRLSLILVDLDGFKDVNDSLGHAAGDQVLKVVAQRLRDLSAAPYLPCRLGGDEFVVLLEDVADPLLTMDLADRLVQAVERPVELGERTVYIGASAGVAVVTDSVWTAELVLEQADLALYRAKLEGKGRARLFTQDLRPTAQRRASVSSGIRRAWEHGEFELYFQPQVRLRDGSLAGAEALIRWNHPEQGVLSPAAFLSTLETSLLAVPVSEWILQTACRRAAAWRVSIVPSFRIGVNLFAAQFRSGDLSAVVERVLGEEMLAADALELEITENTILRNEFRINNTLQELREQNVGIAFDDYGTGFASLTMLKDFPVTRLKIDRSFVSGPDCGDRNRPIVEAISGLARGLDLQVIAEGIETKGQADLMRTYCEEGQGYFFGRPMAASAFESMFLERSSLVGRVSA
jgi:diguanylate cyclase (GGDEF)-like protein/PAS domain S-box-containing protein